MLPKLKKSDHHTNTAKKSLFGPNNEAWKETKQHLLASSSSAGGGGGNDTARSNMTSLSSLSGNTTFTTNNSQQQPPPPLYQLNTVTFNPTTTSSITSSSFLLGEDEEKQEKEMSLFQKGNEEMEGLIPPKDNSEWIDTVGRIQRRRKGWMNRFAHKINETNIVTLPLTKSEAREQRILASGWENTIYTKEDLSKLKPIPIKPVIMQTFPTELNDYAMNLCSFCGKLVSRGAHRVPCQHCSSVSHIQCIPNVESFINQSKRQQNIQRHVNFDIHHSFHSNKYDDFHIIHQAIQNAVASNTSNANTPLASSTVAMTPKSASQRKAEKTRPKSSLKASTPTSSSSSANNTRPSSSPHYKSQRTSSTSTNEKKVSFCVNEQDYTTKDIHWVCSFCRRDKDYFETNSRNQFQHMTTFEQQTHASIKIQSLLRMYMARCQFLTVLKGVIIIQEIFRMKILARKVEREKANRNYAYRLRLHDIKMIICNENPDEKFIMKFPMIPTYHNIGDMRSETFEKYLQEERKEMRDLASSSSASGEGGGISRTASSHGTITHSNSSYYPMSHMNSSTSLNSKKPRKNPLFEFLSHGHVENPPYAKPLRGQTVPKGTLMLTVSVHEYIPDSKAPIVALGSSEQHVHPSDCYQLYRYDLILKESQRVHDITYATLEKRGFVDINRDEVDKLAQQYHMITYSTAKPYLLIPFSSANIEIRMTISEVKEFPKANVIGFNRFYLSHHLTRDRIVSINQSLSHPLSVDLPLSDDSSKLNISIPKYDEKKVKNKMPSYARSSGKPPPTNSLVVKESAPPRDYAQGILTWSLLPIGSSEFNEYGFLTVLQDESAASNKKFWVVLLDGILMVFHIIRDSVQQKYTIDISTSFVQGLSDNMVRVKGVTEILYLIGDDAKEYETWLKKLYSQSQSQQNLPYSVYCRRNRINANNSNNNAAAEVPQVVVSKRVVIVDDPAAKAKANAAAEKKSLFSYNANSRGFNAPGSNVPVATAPQRRDIYSTTGSNRRYSRHPHMHHPNATPAGVVDGIMADIDVFLLKMRKEYIEQYSKQLPDFQVEAKPKRRSMMTTLASSVLHAKAML